MKLSKFLYISRCGKDNYVFFNYSENTIVFVSEDLMSLYESNGMSVDWIENNHPDFFNELVALGMIVDDCVDEMVAYIDKKKSSLFTNNYIHLIINPTLDCNFRCWYCYERHTKGSILSKDVSNSILQHLKNRLSQTKGTPVHLSLFGGEPLLRFKSSIQPLLKEIKEICLIEDRIIILHITTNGYLVNQAIVSFLGTITNRITFQIAFDGGELYHNNTKWSASGDSYRRTLLNVGLILRNNFNVVARINFTNDNIHSIETLINDFDSAGFLQNPKFKVTFEKVWQVSITKQTEDIVERYKNHIRNKRRETCQHVFIPPESCYCDYINTTVINYDGGLYRCTARDFNEDNKSGTIASDGKLALSMNSDDFADELFPDVCKSCFALPVCRVCHQIKKDNKSNECPAKKTDMEKNEMIQRRLIFILEQ